MEFGLFFLMQRDEAWSEQAVYDSGLETVWGNALAMARDGGSGASRRGRCARTTAA